MDTTENFLKQIVDFMPERKSLKYKSIEHFVLENGKAYGEPISFPPGIKRGVAKECFKNAFDLFSLHHKEEWKYVEGYAFSIAIPMLHAWVVNSEGQVIDPTWRDGKDYYGVEFPYQYLVRTMMRTKYYGVLDAWKIGFPLLTGEDPYPIPERS